jgi:hypothetical protein
MGIPQLRRIAGAAYPKKLLLVFPLNVSNVETTAQQCRFILVVSSQPPHGMLILH